MAKILLIGYGYWGQIWYKTIKQSKHKLVAVVDTKFTEGQCVIDLEVQSYEKTEDIKEMFTHAIVAVPVDQHLRIFSELKHIFNVPDKNILIEKPVGMNLKEAEYMKDCCHGLVWLYDTTYRNVKNLVKSGRIGDIKLFQSFRASMGPRIRTDVSIIEDYLFHDIYLYLDLTNHKFKNISNTLSINYNNLRKSMFDHQDSLIQPDTITVGLDDASGGYPIIVELFSSWIYPKKIRKTVIIGTKGSLIWENDDILINNSFYKKLDNSFDKDKNGNIGYELCSVDTLDVTIEASKKSNLEKLLDDFIGKSLFEDETEDTIPISSFRTIQGNLAIQTHRVISKIKEI